MLWRRRTTAEGTSTVVVDELASSNIALRSWRTPYADTSRSTLSESSEVVSVTSATPVFEGSAFVRFRIISISLEDSRTFSDFNRMFADIE